MSLRVTVFATTLEFELGGIARSVPRMAAALAECGVEVVLLAPAPKVSTLSEPFQNGLTVRLGANAAETVELLKEEIGRLKAQGGLLYHAGVWSPWNHRCCRLARRAAVPYIASPRSMLDPWALQYRGLKKKIAWALYAKHDLNQAAGIHATCELEADHIRACGVTAPIFVVPHGVDGPPTDCESVRSKGKLRRILFLSRLHPKKGIEDLINAFAGINPADWELVIAGNDDGGYEKGLRGLAARSAASARIHFNGPVTDAEKWSLYASSELFVLPSYSENFGLVVGEALASGIPVITTQETPWQELSQHGCGWCIPAGESELVQTLASVLSMDKGTLQTMGANGRGWMRDAFSWEVQAKKFMQAVSNLSGCPERIYYE